MEKWKTQKISFILSYHNLSKHILKVQKEVFNTLHMEKWKTLNLLADTETLKNSIYNFIRNFFAGKL